MNVSKAVSPLPIVVPAAICRDFERSSRLEWLETNHTGGFAMGTVAGVNTRRYHSLLVSSQHPPADRTSIVPRVEERVSVGQQTFDLATAQYPGAVYPRGFELLNEFRLDPFPTWRYQAGSAILEKQICLLDGQQSVLVSYHTTQPCRLQVRLLLALRDYHSTLHLDSYPDLAVDETPGRLWVRWHQNCTVIHNAQSFQADHQCFHHNEYLRELDRGLDFREDLPSPGVLAFDLAPGRLAWFVVSAGDPNAERDFDETSIPQILASEAHRREFVGDTPVAARLRAALDQFRVVRADGQPSLVAGYPWFTDWSRDTLISLPALRAGGFRQEETRAILSMLLQQRSQGILPNRFSDQQSKPEFNTADATLWMFVAARDYVQTYVDVDFVRDCLYPAAQDILDWHERGTHYGIGVDPIDGLLSAGNSSTQLTWMDAKVGNHVITPRNGKPVEINALFYNALRITAEWADLLGRHADSTYYSDRARVFLHSFRKSFWNETGQYLYDVITPTGPDTSVRPNQLFAFSLPFPLLDENHARLVLNAVQNDLLTPMGLRTLSPADHAYRGRFEGSPGDRDGAYHQGTVWPWLMGPYAAAYLYAHNESADAVQNCCDLLAGLESELTTCCLGSLSEVYDGDQPRRPGGCPAQLWSVAQLMIALNHPALKRLR